MTDKDIQPDLIRRLMEARGISAKQLAKALNVSEASVFRWLKGTRPTGTAAAILGLLIFVSGLSRNTEVKSCARRGLSLYREIGSLIDPNDELVRDLEHSLGLERLKELQKEEYDVISKELEEAEQEAKEAITKLHKDQRKLFKESFDKEQEKITRRLQSLTHLRDERGD